MPSIRVLGHAFRAWRRNKRWAKHEPETPYLADLLNGSPVCLHVGASDGRHSYVMTQVAPKAQVHAFEPSAFTFEVLKICLAWHRIAGQVRPVHAAVADMPGELLLVTPKKTSGRMGRAYAYVATEPPTGQVRPVSQNLLLVAESGERKSTLASLLLGCHGLLAQLATMRGLLRRNGERLPSPLVQAQLSAAVARLDALLADAGGEASAPAAAAPADPLPRMPLPGEDLMRWFERRLGLVEAAAARVAATAAAMVALVRK